jgi:hypothetical protein
MNWPEAFVAAVAIIAVAAFMITGIICIARS